MAHWLNTWESYLIHEKVTSVQMITLPLTQVHYKSDVRGSVHHSTIHTEIANKMQQCIKIYYSMFIWSSTCFGQHTAHHQQLETALATSGFAYVKGCWTLWLLDADSVQQPQRPTTFHVRKTGGCQRSFELLMMGGVSPETLLDVVVAGCWQRPATSTSNNLSRMQNRRLPAQFRAPDDGRRVARNMLSFI